VSGRRSEQAGALAGDAMQLAGAASDRRLALSNHHVARRVPPTMCRHATVGARIIIID